MIFRMGILKAALAVRMQRKVSALNGGSHVMVLCSPRDYSVHVHALTKGKWAYSQALALLQS